MTHAPDPPMMPKGAALQPGAALPVDAVLPIDAVLPAVIAALAEGGRAVLQAPPGAGKTTRVPLALLASGLLGDPVHGRILMLEPRRIAARAAAERMAATLGEPVGGTVGYRIRGEAKTSAATRIEVVTEGILTRMIQAGADLPGIGALIFDEFHERALNADLGLALALDLAAGLRPDLLLLVMSATLDAGPVAALLGGAPLITSEGRAFPVETRWLARPLPSDARFEPAVAALIRQAIADTEGGLLVFLPGEREIRRVGALLADLPAAGPAGIVLRPLYGAMDLAAQRAALAPLTEGRKLVLATAIAETSLTFPDIRVVIDAGRARRARVDPGSGMSRLVTERVTRAEADQRRGRAGRVAGGICYRMWTRGEEGALAAFPPPEIEVADLASLALELALWGASETDLAFLTPPPGPALAEARTLLTGLGALETGPVATRGIASQGSAGPPVTAPGMSGPGHGRSATQADGSATVTPAAPTRNSAMTPPAGSAAPPPAAPPPATRPPAIAVPESRSAAAPPAATASPATLSPTTPAPMTTGTPAPSLRHMITRHGTALAALPLHPRLGHMLVRVGPSGAPLAALLADRDPLGPGSGADLALRLGAVARGDPAASRAVLDRIRAEVPRLARLAPPATDRFSAAEMAALAYPDRIGLRRDGPAPRYLLSGGKGAVIDAGDPLARARLIVATDLDGDPREARIRQGIALSDGELHRVHGVAVCWHDRVQWSRRDGRVLARREQRFGALVLAERPLADPDPADLHAALMDGLRHTGLEWSDAARRLQSRVALLAREGADLPGVTDDDLLARPDWFTAHFAGARTEADLRRIDPGAVLLAALTRDQRQMLDRLAPAGFATPLGRTVPIDYGGTHPAIALRLQELFGVNRHPTVGPKALPLRITLLSPGGHPVQVTMDLPGFWAASYSDVRRDMRGQYPKHPWPEDPRVAEPTLRAKPRRR